MLAPIGMEWNAHTHSQRFFTCVLHKWYKPCLQHVHVWIIEFYGWHVEQSIDAMCKRAARDSYVVPVRLYMNCICYSKKFSMRFNTLFICDSSAPYIRFTCDLHTIYMRFICALMRLKCELHALYMWFTSNLRAIYIRLTNNLHEFDMQIIKDIRTIYKSNNGRAMPNRTIYLTGASPLGVYLHESTKTNKEIGIKN